MKKLFLTAFLTAYLVMGGNGFAGVVASGSCAGDGTSTCAWTYDDTTHTLSIKGSGSMADYGYTESSAERKQQYPNDTWVTTAPWKDYVDDIHEVSISQGITNIGQGFLTGAQGITHIDIPQGVTDIGYGAFMDVSAQSVSLPEGLTTIGGWAFSTASPGITSINLPSTLTTIWDGGLYYLQAESVLIPDGLKVLGGTAIVTSGPLQLYCQDTSAHTCSDLINSSTGGVENLKVYSYDSASGLYFVDGDGEYFGSTNDMLQGSDYSCGATTSICATVLSEVGGANCNTIKSCRNLAEMADENVYCNSMSTCKELTDLVASETYCDSLESCKELSDMATSGEYCTTVEECKALNDMVGGENCDSLESCKALSDMAASGEYCTTVAECKALNDMVGGENCDSLESCKALSDMAASGEYCSTVAECKRFMELMNSGYCEGFAACKEMFNASVINYDGKRYGSLEDLYNGNALPSITRQEQGDGSFAVYKDGVFAGYKGKRIYTVNEAENVTGRKNTLKIRYR